ncbi:MAG TPA: hypothetical protein DCL44_04445 [Elusimicrobia bacterium]|nr:hypothetical protein [Elusimicrobiota bacterium]
MIKATPEQLETIAHIISTHAHDVETRVFGSRVAGTPKDYSDLDVALVGAARLDTAIIGAIKEAFEESDLPFRIDVLDWNSISEEFQKVILKNYEVLPLPNKT